MLFDDQRVDLARVTHAEANALRRRTGFVFQSYNLFANKTALQNVTEGLSSRAKCRAAGLRRSPAPRWSGSAWMTAPTTTPTSFPAGQRVAIARAMAADRRLFILTNPRRLLTRS